MSLVLPKKSPLTQQFNGVLQKLVESGLIDKWKRDEMDKAFRLGQSNGNTVLEVAQPLGIEVLKGAFLFLASGWALCLFVCSVEVLVYGIANLPAPISSTDLSSHN